MTTPVGPAVEVDTEVGRPPVSRPLEHQLELLRHLVAQQFRERYRRNRLGWTWAIIQPLLLLLVYVFVFGTLHEFDRVDRYPLYVFIGITAVGLFQAGVVSALYAPVARQDLVLLPGFDRRLIPVAALLMDTIDFAMTIPVLLGFLAVTDGIPLTAPLALVPVLLLWSLTLGLGLVLGVVNVFLRDVGALTVPLLRTVFFLTPTFWVEDAIPERFDWLPRWNPLAGILAAMRSVLMDGDGLPWHRLGPGLATAAVLLGLGLLLFRRYGAELADQL